MISADFYRLTRKHLAYKQSWTRHFYRSYSSRKMPSRLDFLTRKLDELEDAIRLEKREYDKARDRYDKMTRREILEDLRGQ